MRTHTNHTIWPRDPSTLQHAVSNQTNSTGTRGMRKDFQTPGFEVGESGGSTLLVRLGGRSSTRTTGGSGVAGANTLVDTGKSSNCSGPQRLSHVGNVIGPTGARSRPSPAIHGGVHESGVGFGTQRRRVHVFPSGGESGLSTVLHAAVARWRVPSGPSQGGCVWRSCSGRCRR
jgi:hypothetical protein